METPLASGAGELVEPDMAASCSWVEISFYLSIESPDLRQQEAAIRALSAITVGPTCERLTRSAGFALQKILNALNLSPNKLLKHTVVLFLRRFFEFQHRAAVETLLALEQSTCEQIFDILLRSMEDGPDVAEDACYAVYYLAKCHPYLQNILAKFSEQCVWSLYATAHNDVGQSGLRMASYEALHEVVRFVAAPVISKLISHAAFDLQKAFHARDTNREKYIQYECRGLEIILHKFGEGPPTYPPISKEGRLTSEVTQTLFEQHFDMFAELLIKVLHHTKADELWKDVFIAVGALAHASGPAFKRYMPMFFELWIFGLQFMRAGEIYDAMVVVMIRITRALKGNMIAYCDEILSQLHKDLFSTDLYEISECSILCCYAELALAIGVNFHKHLGCTMDTLGKLTSSKHDVLLKPEGRHFICAMLETYFAISRCFEGPSVSHLLSPFASDILGFLRVICGLDMDARVTTATIEFVRWLATVHGEIFSSLIYNEKSIRSFLNQCLISKDPLIKVCADLANDCLLHATYDLRWSLLESEISEKLLSALTFNPVMDEVNEYSEQQLLSTFYNLSRGVDSYGNNPIAYVSLSSILLKDDEHAARRILAGKILLTALGSEKKWDFLDHQSRSCIIKCLVQTLFCCDIEACSMAIKILKHIGGLLRGFGNLVWNELKKFFCSDVDHHQLHVKYLSLEMIATVIKDGLCRNSEKPDARLMNELHNAILKIIRAEHNDDVILNWLQILSYSRCRPENLSDDIQNFIFDAAKSPEVKIKVAGLECLTDICSTYGVDKLGRTRTRSLISEAMEETDNRVAYQAILFWVSVCQVAKGGGINYSFVMETSKSLVEVLLEILFTRCTRLLEPTDPDQHREIPDLAKAASKCLRSVAQSIGNKIIKLVEKNVLLGIESSNVRHREAGIRALGSILVGPSPESLCSLITSAFPSMLHALEGCTDNSVGYAVTWTLSQVFELHHPIVKTLIVPKYQYVIEFLQLGIMDVPIVAKNACHALSSLVQGVDAYMWDNLSPNFDVLVKSLYAVGHDESVGFVELKEAAYEALHEFMKCANGENLEVMLCLTTVVMDDLSHALEAKEYTIEGLKNQCRSLLVITQKLGTSEKHRPHFMRHVHHIITLLTGVIECGSVIVFKEAMLAVGAIAYVNGGAFEEHVRKLEKCWEVGVQFFKQHVDVYLVMLWVIVDVCRALGKKMLQFCDKIMIPLSIDASSIQQYGLWGPSISCICEIAGAVGDNKFLKHAMHMLQDKTWFCIDREKHFDWDAIWYLRPGLVEAYRAIFQRLKNCPVSDPLLRFADDTLDVLLKLSSSLYLENDMDHVITRKVFEVLEHLSTRKGCSMTSLISQSSLITSSESNQRLAHHLCKPRPSLIKLVQRSFQNESSKRRCMDFVGGYELVEVYAVHVKTEQPCNLYGAIKVSAGIVSQCVYNQERDDAEPVSSGETALLFNVLEIIPGVEGITLEVDLKHKVGEGGASTDGEVCWNKTTMICGEDVHRGYNQPLQATLEGKIGSARISFIRYDCATPTYVKVAVVRPCPGIHGQITAYNMRCPSIRRELFRRSCTNVIGLDGKEARLKINLYEGVIVVPLNSILVVKADLRLPHCKPGHSSRLYMKFSEEFNVIPDRSTSKTYRVRGSIVKVDVHFGI